MVFTFILLLIIGIQVPDPVNFVLGAIPNLPHHQISFSQQSNTENLSSSEITTDEESSEIFSESELEEEDSLLSNSSAITNSSSLSDSSSNLEPPSNSSESPIISTPNPTPVPAPSEKVIVGYYTGWSSYKGYTPDKIPVENLTHLNYAFAKIDPSTQKIALADPANDRNNFEVIRKLKQKNPNLKTLISVGGWDYSTHFSTIAATPDGRERFAQSCVDFILEYGFDGIDIDWEYPVSGGASGNSNRPQDKENFTLLLQTIREKLNQQSLQDNKKYYLTIAAAASNSYLSKIEPKNVSGIVDYIFVMTYDIHGPWDKYADFNAPLYTPEEDSPNYKNSVSESISAYLDHGVSMKKLVLGMPFYGYLYQDVSSENNGLYSTFSSAKSISYDIIKSTYLTSSDYSQLRHKTAKVPYLYGNGIFISYEDPQSISDKVSLAKSLGLAGIGAWEHSHDSSGILLKSAYQTLY